MAENICSQPTIESKNSGIGGQDLLDNLGLSHMSAFPLKHSFSRSVSAFRDSDVLVTTHHERRLEI